jgi:hypothetical protein
MLGLHIRFGTQHPVTKSALAVGDVIPIRAPLSLATSLLRLEGQAFCVINGFYAQR